MSRRDRNASIEATLGDARTAGRRQVRVECPRATCVSSKTLRPDKSVNVDLVTGMYHCHRCGLGGRLEGEQYILLDDSDEPTNEELEARKRAAQPPTGYVPLWCGDHATSWAAAPARAYAASRGFDAERLRAFRVGAVLFGYYGGRLVLPLTDDDGEWWGWVARAYTPAAAAAGKYLYPKGMPRGEYLFNGAALNPVFVDDDDPAIIVEGYLDCVPYWPDAIPTLGQPSRFHVRLFETASRPVAFLLDGDAWEEAMMYAARLRFAGKRAGYVRLPPKTDPNEVDIAWAREECRRCLDRPL